MLGNTPVTAMRLAGHLALRVAVALAGLFVLLVGVGPMTGLYRTATVLTGSMAPAMPAGSMAVVVPAPTRALHAGEVITYQAPIPGRPVITHRIVEIARSNGAYLVQTKGDANEAADPWVAQISAPTAYRRVAVLPYLGTLNRALRSAPVHLALSYLTPMCLLLALLGAIWKPNPAGETPLSLLPGSALALPSFAAVVPARVAITTPSLAPGAAALASFALRVVARPGRHNGGRSPRRPDVALGLLALVAVPAASLAVRRSRP